MQLNFSFRVIDTLISRAKRAEAKSCGLNTEATALVEKLTKISSNHSRFAHPDSITLNEEELKILGLL